MAPHDTEGSAYCVPPATCSSMNAAPAGGVSVASYQPQPAHDVAGTDQFVIDTPVASRQKPRKFWPPTDQHPTVTDCPGRSGTISYEPCALPGRTVMSDATDRATVPSGSCTRPASVASAGATSNPDACGERRFPTTASGGYQPTGPTFRATASSVDTSPGRATDTSTDHVRRPPFRMNAFRLPPSVVVNETCC